MNPAAQRSANIRRLVLELAHGAKSGHIGSALSCVDILAVLYFDFLKVDPENPTQEDRDRFILSKGHATAALYAVLAQRRFFPVEQLLREYLQDNGRFPGHPDARIVPGVDASTGSLGHGLNLATGIALAAKLDGRPFKSVALLSDGECDEGSTWEAILAAGNWKLDNLFCIVDYNKIQAFGRVQDVQNLEPFADKWRSFGWDVSEADGHDPAAILEGLKRAVLVPDKPHVLIAHTVKGKGVSFMENKIEWHYWPMNDEQYSAALQELPH